MADARSTPILRTVLTATMGLPFLLAVVAQCKGHAPRPIAPAADRPALAFAQYLVDLGEVAPSEEVLAHFSFANLGGTAVHVEGFEASCGCLQPVLQKKDYAPGQSGRFMLRVQTANQSFGAKEYWVKMKYADPHPREAMLTFRVVLPENKVSIEPRAIIVYQPPGPAISRKIEILDSRPEPLTVTRVECTRPNLAEVFLGDSTVDEYGVTRTKLTVMIPGNLPAGRHDAVVRVFTADPEYRTLRIPLRIDSTGEHIDSQIRPVEATDEEDTGRVVPAH